MIPISRPIIGDEERAAVDRVLQSGMLVAGAEVAAFETEFAELCGTDHAVAVGSGTAALHVGLLASGIGPGDEVIVPSFTFAATANAVRMVGADPVFAEIEDRTFSLTADAVRAALSPRTAAVMPVHLFGHPALMSEIMDVASGAGIAVFEDSAQAHGATVDGRPVGGMGEWGAFSFYPTKNMTTGEGGMITTNDARVARNARLIRNQGMEQRYVHEVPGLNERMTEIEGAIGRIQLRHLHDWTEARRSNAAFYSTHLSRSADVPIERDGYRHVYHQYTIRLADRTSVIDALEAEGIGYGIYYPLPTHLQAPYRDIGASLPVTERVAEQVLSIPVRPDLTAEERKRIVDVVNEVIDT